jgi:hypothetical protein
VGTGAWPVCQPGISPNAQYVATFTSVLSNTALSMEQHVLKLLYYIESMGNVRNVVAPNIAKHSKTIFLY